MASEKRWPTKSLEMTDSCFKEKLQIEKSNLTFRKYVYSILFYLERGETSLFGSSFYLTLFLLMTLIGFKNLFGWVETCPFPERLISVCLMQSGILGSTIHAINLGFHLFGAKNRYLDKCKMGFRIVLLLNNGMGFAHLFSKVLPTAEDEPCYFYMHWFSTYAFVSGSFAEILYAVLLIVASVYYFV